MLYIRLFHGRIDPEQEMDDWGSDGPVFGPFDFVHTTYTSFVRLGRKDGTCNELNAFQDMLYYDGIYYGDWSIFDSDVLKKSEFRVSRFDQNKAKLSRESGS